jgi:hypothetical protein
LFQRILSTFGGRFASQQLRDRVDLAAGAADEIAKPERKWMLDVGRPEA